MKIISARLHTLLSLFLVLTLASCGASDSASTDNTDSQKALLYKVTHPDQAKPAYLFGTMHLMKSGYLTNWPAVKEAFQKADQVVVETVIDSSKLMQVGRMAIMQNNTYKGLYDSATLDTVNRYLNQNLSMPTATLKRLKPMQLSLLTTQQAYQQVSSPLKSAKGTSVDQYFATKGEEMGKTITPLETMMEQGRMLFNEMSNQEQADMLIQQIRQEDQMATFTELLL